MYLLNEVDARLEVETKVDEVPFDALLAVLLLFQHKHVMVEELLQLLVGQVDAQLLKGVHLEHSHKISHESHNIFPIDHHQSVSYVVSKDNFLLLGLVHIHTHAQVN